MGKQHFFSGMNDGDLGPESANLGLLLSLTLYLSKADNLHAGPSAYPPAESRCHIWASQRAVIIIGDANQAVVHRAMVD